MAPALSVCRCGQGRGTPMSQITLAIRHARQSERLLRWQVTVNGALAGGSLIAALFQLGALVGLSLARSMAAHAAAARRAADHHA